jgi:hypothetical protein
MQSNRRIFCSFLVLFIFLFAPFLGIQNSFIFASDKLNFSAEIIEYKKFCDFKVKEEPRKITFSANSNFGFVSCDQITKKYKDAKIVKVYVKNVSASDIQLSISKRYSNIVLTNKEGQKFSPVAFRNVQTSMGQKQILYLTDLDGEMKLLLPKTKDDNLIFIFEKASAGQTLKFGDLFSVELKKD